jgi:RHS repeat-associated protein
LADVRFEFGYNPASQIVTRTGTNDSYAWTGHGSGSTPSVADGLNRLSSIGGSAASYDPRGNLTSDPTSGKAFTYWPSDNALWTASPPWSALSYDPLGRLALIDSAADTAFAYDGLDMIAEYDGAGTMLARYVHGPGPSAGSGQAIDQPLVRYDGSGTSNKQSLHADERGSITALSYGAPYAPTINRYDEYGKPQAGNIGRFQYTGQMWLSEAGAYHYKARVYAPQLGRFLQTDPAGMAGSPNLYAYVINDPIGLVDPFGLVQCTGSHLNRDNCGNSPDPVTCMGDCSRWATIIPKYGAGASSNREGAGAQWSSAGFWYCTNCGQPGVAESENSGVVTSPQYAWVPSVQLVQFAPWLEPLLPHFLDPLLPLSNEDCREACFEAGTLVATPTGLRLIEQIAVGDLVMSQDERTGTVAAKKVTRLIRPNPKPVYELALRDAGGELETFRVTADHRWKVDGEGWIATDELEIGDHIDTESKVDVTVTSVSLTDRIEATYNLEVADWHTFMVGKGHAVVHNGCPKPPKNWRPPTNPPRLPPAAIPEGWKLRYGAPNQIYPNGYWRLEKPMANGGWQGINPATMKPGPQWETHVPLPPGY